MPTSYRLSERRGAQSRSFS